jgi:hypothetical protein
MSAYCSSSAVLFLCTVAHSSFVGPVSANVLFEMWTREVRRARMISGQERGAVLAWVHVWPG